MTLGRQIVLALAITVVTSAAVYLIASVVPKTYESEQVLLFPGGQPSVPSLATAVLGNNPGASGDVPSYSGPGGFNYPVVASGIDVAKGLLDSRNCMVYVCEKLDLPGKWKMSAWKAQDELRRRAKSKIDDNGFLRITCQTGSPEEARDIAKTMYDYLGTDAVRLTLKIGSRNKKVIEDRLAVAQERMLKARNNLVSVATNHPFVESTPMQDLLADALKKQGETKVAIAGAESRIKSVEDTVRRAIASGTDMAALEASSGGLVDKGMENLIQDLHKRRLDLEDAKRTYTEKSPEFKVAAERSKAGQSVVKQTMDDSAKSLGDKTYPPLIQARAELASLKQVLSGYDSIMAKYKQLALKTPDDGTLVKIAQSQFETALKTSESLRFQLEQATIAEERDPARYEVVDEAVADPDPIAPRKGLVTGAWAACVLALSSWMIVRKKINFVD